MESIVDNLLFENDETLNMERTKYNNNGEFLFIFNFTNPILACLYSFSLV